jgi:hypothetical protein
MTTAISYDKTSRFLSFCASAVFCATFLVGQAAAAPVTWYLDDATFFDGGVAIGSFVYDAATNTFSDISVTTSGGSNSGSTYSHAAPTADSGRPIFTTATGVLSGLPVLLFTLVADMTDAGGDILISLPDAFSSEGLCQDATCSNFDVASDRLFASGSITSINPVPIPPALFLLGTALAGVAGFNRLKRRRTTTAA